MEKKQAHLEIIQGVVNRLSQNSFLLKGWSVVLIAALFALAAKESNTAFVYLACFPLLAFWFLDGYFLWQERLYRNLYDKVRVMDEGEIDFSMSTADCGGKRASWLSSIFSKTLLAFHGVILCALVVVVLLMNSAV